MITVYGDRISGNCHKVLFVAHYLKLPFEWVDVDILQGASRTEEFLEMNPAGQVPTVRLPDGEFLAQSNAITSFLADGTDLIPSDTLHRAKMLEWMFWEQYSHETAVAVIRFQKHYLGWSDDELDSDRVERGNAALDLMDGHLDDRDWFVGNSVTLADVALVAYTRLAEEGGFSLPGRPNVAAWVGRTERALDIPGALAALASLDPLDDHLADELEDQLGGELGGELGVELGGPLES